MSMPSYGSFRGGGRFYNPPQVRRHHHHQYDNDHESKEQVRREKFNHHTRRQNLPSPPVVAVVKKSSTSSTENNCVECDDCGWNIARASTAAMTVETPHGGGDGSALTNLDRFLEYTTPLVPAQYLFKTSMKGWKTQENEFRHYFVLDDLWESFNEWSAYGAGVPLLLNGRDSVVQYYVPYLSGIQLYIDPSTPFPRTRMTGGVSDESSRETSSGGSSDCETERASCSFGSWSQHDLPESTIESLKGLSLRCKPFNGSSSSSDEGECSPGALAFEYLEHDPPYSREPLSDKISLLASRFPELKTYRSCDLTPSSWISVAWYPIYRIPTGPTLQNLDSCFLTFHSLSTPLHGGRTDWQSHYGSCPRETPNGFNMDLKIPLSIFGMAFYKFKFSVWDQNGVAQANSLLHAADEWLQLLGVNLPDYQFFASHNINWR